MFAKAATTASHVYGEDSIIINMLLSQHQPKEFSIMPIKIHLWEYIENPNLGVGM